jgi:hypothetical protein
VNASFSEEPDASILRQSWKMEMQVPLKKVGANLMTS